MNNDSKSFHAHSRQPSDAQALGFLTRLYKSAAKPKAIDPEDNNQFRSRVRHVLKPGERLIEFVARTGLGPWQAGTLSQEEISRFVEQAERNRAEEPLPPPPVTFPEVRDPAVTSLVMIG